MEIKEKERCRLQAAKKAAMLAEEEKEQEEEEEHEEEHEEEQHVVEKKKGHKNPGKTKEKEVKELSANKGRKPEDRGRTICREATSPPNKHKHQ
jgi:hypothetical protein